MAVLSVLVKESLNMPKKTREDGEVMSHGDNLRHDQKQTLVAYGVPGRNVDCAQDVGQVAS